MSLLQNDYGVFAGTSGGGVYRTADEGQTWTWVSGGGAQGCESNSLAQIGSYMFASSWGSWVWRSSNNGDTWEIVDGGLTTSHLQSLGTKDTTLFAGRYGGGPGTGVFRSTNYGVPWFETANGLTNSYVYSITSNETNVFLRVPAAAFLLRLIMAIHGLL